jgi:glycosyltransferase involved in cell wall biosynthesis
MNVFFDYQIFYLQKYGGISRYFYELAKELNQIKTCEPKIIVPFHGNDYIKQAGKQDYIYTYGTLRKKLYYNRYYNKQIERNVSETKRFCNSAGKKLLHETFYLDRIKTDIPKVITIHDMIPELFDDNSVENKQVISCKKKAIQEASLIIAVSENTRKDLIQFYPEISSKTHVVYHGIEQVSSAEKIAVSEKPYLLFVGNRVGYKNFKLLLEVYCSDKIIHTAFNLICFGGSKITAEEEHLIQKHHAGNKIKFMSGTDEELGKLYKNASVLVYTSAYEGFGLPVLEAMKFSCPVLCSNASSLPEVAGDAALMLNVSDQNQLVKGLHAILFDNDLRKDLILKGINRAKQFTWKKCAGETFEKYKLLF